MDQDIEHLESEIQELRELLSQKEDKLRQLKALKNNSPLDSLTNEDIARYSRQIILPEIGVNGQIKLKNSSFLIVGAGGLGCPALLYLVSAGAGTVGIVDYDIVEKNNLHRQTLHNEENLGRHKTYSAQSALSKMNSECKIHTYSGQLSSDNALDVINGYTVVLDCSDNVATRYLLNDACVLTGKPLVSGSALQLEGQLTVYNYKEGPCYRCIFPTPPPPAAITNCGDGGVLGAVTGTIGSLQALEAIKIAIGFGEVLNGRLLVFDGNYARFRNIKLRPKCDDCAVCSEKPIITQLIDYELFCGMRASDKDFALSLLGNDERISVGRYEGMIKTNTAHLLIDVRSPNEFEICHLENSINIPLKELLEDLHLEVIKDKMKNSKLPILCICRRGNDSQIAAQHLQEKLKNLAEVKDIIGGLHAWHYYVDKEFPIY